MAHHLPESNQNDPKSPKKDDHDQDEDDKDNDEDDHDRNALEQKRKWRLVTNGDNDWCC